MGRLSFLNSHVAGRLLRGCLSPLAQRAYEKHSFSLSPIASTALQFAQLLLQRFPARAVDFSHRAKIVSYWTDAMWEPGKPAGLGAVLHVPG